MILFGDANLINRFMMSLRSERGLGGVKLALDYDAANMDSLAIEGHRDCFGTLRGPNCVQRAWCTLVTHRFCIVKSNFEALAIFAQMTVWINIVAPFGFHGTIPPESYRSFFLTLKASAETKLVRRKNGNRLGPGLFVLGLLELFKLRLNT